MQPDPGALVVYLPLVQVVAFLYASACGMITVKVLGEIS